MCRVLYQFDWKWFPINKKSAQFYLFISSMVTQWCIRHIRKLCYGSSMFLCTKSYPERRLYKLETAAAEVISLMVNTTGEEPWCSDSCYGLNQDGGRFCWWASWWHQTKGINVWQDRVWVSRRKRMHVNSPHKGPVMRKMFSFDDVIMAQA